MNIQNNNSNLNFGAKYIKTTKIKRMLPNVKPLKVTFVEIDPKNLKDVNAIEKVNKMWENALFAENINAMLRKIYCEAPFFENAPHIFAVTLQKKRLHKLKSNDVLGLVEVGSFGSRANINYIQAKPDFLFSVKGAKYKNIGESMINVLKKMFPQKICAKSLYSATEFYERNGFKLTNAKNLEYEWVGTQSKIDKIL